MIKIVAASFLLLFTLAACTTTDKLVSVGVACDTYASTLKVVAGMNERGWLGQQDILIVDKVVATVGPTCKNTGLDSTAAPMALTRIQEGIKALLIIKAEG
jgi:hypothetical protein